MGQNTATNTNIAPSKYSKALVMQPMANTLSHAKVSSLRPRQINLRNPPSRFEEQYKDKLTKYQFGVAYRDNMGSQFPHPPNEFAKKTHS